MKYFGTDGIRGQANVKLTPELAFKVGRYLGFKLRQDKNAKFLIGRDPRKSGQMLEAALASGLAASGCNVDLVGVVVTPLLSYLLDQGDYVGGIMITASHNPYYDNGLKVMNSKGLKIGPFLQDEIEAYLNDEIEIPYMLNDDIGSISNQPELIKHYKDLLKKSFQEDLSNFKVAIDAANGSASALVDIFSEFNVDATVINKHPNGVNINNNCGSTHPEVLQAFMKDKDFDLGVTFDGDGDRLMLVDEKNNIVDGDGILYAIACYYQDQKKLTTDTIVVTVMSNLGLHKALNKRGINTFVTDVGDKNVFERMIADDHLIGGEQSGHIILKEFSNMGDGILVALEILNIMAKNKKSMSQLSEGLKIYPQILENIKVKDVSKILKDKEVESIINKVTVDLNDEGRVLVRASGTEPLIRVMVEAETYEKTKASVEEIMAVIKNKI